MSVSKKVVPSERSIFRNETDEIVSRELLVTGFDNIDYTNDPIEDARNMLYQLSSENGQRRLQFRMVTTVKYSVEVDAGAIY
jgi:hypothetical protein